MPTHQVLLTYRWYLLHTDRHGGVRIVSSYYNFLHCDKHFSELMYLDFPGYYSYAFTTREIIQQNPNYYEK